MNFQPVLSSNKAAADIACLIRQDPGNRGFAALVPEDQLLMAASALNGRNRCLLLTGFYVSGSETGETDGLTGSLVLADCLYKAGKQVNIVTDRYSAPLLTAGTTILNQKLNIVNVCSDQQKAEIQLIELMKDFNPDCLIAIERPGKASDGHSYSMRCERISHLIPQMDFLFQPPFSEGIATIGIGDGGNEMGMGSYYDRICAAIPEGGQIGCVTPADYCIGSGISNWAGYALAALMTLFSKQWLLPPAGSEMKLLHAMVKAGAVDGTTKKPEVSVDGIDCNLYLDVISKIEKITEKALEHKINCNGKGVEHSD